MAVRQRSLCRQNLLAKERIEIGGATEPGGVVEEEGADVAAALREALVEGGANEREEKQREHGEGVAVAEPRVGAAGRVKGAGA